VVSVGLPRFDGELSLKFYFWRPDPLKPLLIWTVACLAHHPFLVPLCLIWVARIRFDRMLGYGLKYNTAFKDTHLTRV